MTARRTRQNGKASSFPTATALLPTSGATNPTASAVASGSTARPARTSTTSGSNSTIGPRLAPCLPRSRHSRSTSPTGSARWSGPTWHRAATSPTKGCAVATSCPAWVGSGSTSSRFQTCRLGSTRYAEFASAAPRAKTPAGRRPNVAAARPANAATRSPRPEPLSTCDDNADHPVAGHDRRARHP